jgi:hypothetical protein
VKQASHQVQSCTSTQLFVACQALDARFTLLRELVGILEPARGSLAGFFVFLRLSDAVLWWQRHSCNSLNQQHLSHLDCELPATVACVCCACCYACCPALCLCVLLLPLSLLCCPRVLCFCHCCLRLLCVLLRHCATVTVACCVCCSYQVLLS